MRRLDLTPDGAAIVIGILAHMGCVSDISSDAPSGSVTRFSLDVPDSPPQPVWICQPIKFEPSGRNPEYRSIASCSTCGEKVWKDKRALANATVQCHNCAVADMLDRLGVNIGFLEDMIPHFGDG